MRVQIVIAAAVLTTGCGAAAGGPLATSGRSPSARGTAAASFNSTAAPSVMPSSSYQEVTGFGATLTSWNSHHVAASASVCASANTCYNPDPSLDASIAAQVTYYSLASDGRVVYGYLKRLHSGTSLAQAKASALAEFPSDVRVVDFRRLDTCALMLVQSTNMARSLSSAGFGMIQGAIVGLYTVDSQGSITYQPNGVNELSFSTTTSGSLDGEHC
jgi:hypothetical protein